jgi:CubicO group peptidase (beta-lactamase class C family)
MTTIVSTSFAVSTMASRRTDEFLDAQLSMSCGPNTKTFDDAYATPTELVTSSTTDHGLQHAVQTVLVELVTDGDEVGLQAVVMKDGALVADAQSGVADPASGEPVSASTLFFAGSTAKGVLSSLVHVLVAAGTLDYDLRLAEVWPEFAAHGKGNVTVRHVLMHDAGVPGLPPDLTTEQLCDWDHMCAVVAGATPWWPPGTAFGYHAQTFGFLLGETLQRTTDATSSPRRSPRSAR